MDMSVHDTALPNVANMVATDASPADDIIVCHIRVPHTGEVDAGALAHAIDSTGADNWLDAVREADAISFETLDLDA